MKTRRAQTKLLNAWSRCERGDAGTAAGTGTAAAARAKRGARRSTRVTVCGVVAKRLWPAGA